MLIKPDVTPASYLVTSKMSSDANGPRVFTSELNVSASPGVNLSSRSHFNGLTFVVWVKCHGNYYLYYLEIWYKCSFQDQL